MCVHLKDYIDDVGTKDYSVISSVFVSSVTPALRVKKLQLLYCHQCKVTNRRLHACLHCIFIGCFSEEHMKQHAHNTSHELAVELTYGNVFCFQCEDYVYDSRFDDIREGFQALASVSFGAPGWKASQEDVELVKLHHPSRELSCMANYGMRGLVNLGNTCFINSIVQALVHTPLLRDYFLVEKHKCGLDEEKCFACEVARLFHEFYSGTMKPLVLDHLLCMVWTYKRQLAGYEQQDAHEFFIAMLDMLHRHCQHDNNNKSLDQCNCIIDRIFTGQMQSDLVCQSCHGVSSTIEPFWDISLDLGPSVPSKVKGSSSVTPDKENDPTLMDCLSRFTQPEHLGPSCKIKCNKCKTYQESTKQLSMLKLPVIVSFHLKRFEHSSMMHKKISTYIKFPEYLDMTPFTSNYLSGADKPSPSNSGVKLQDNRYCLYAVVNHRGSMNSGHYTAFIRQEKNHWFKCDDNKITRVNIDDVLKSEGYLLLYHKRVLYYS